MKARALWRLFAAFSPVFIFFACGSATCEIEGSVPAAGDGTMVYMLSADENYTPLDSAVVQGGRFRFERNADSPLLCMLLADKQAVGGPVVLEEGHVHVKMEQTMWRGGTFGNKVLQGFIDSRERAQNLASVTSPAFLRAMPVGKSMLDSLLTARADAERVFENYALAAIEQNVHNQLGIYMLSQCYESLDATVVNSFLLRVPKYLRDSRYDIVRSFTDQRLAAVNRRKATAVGCGYQNFELPDLSGEKVLFSNIVNKNKYTLLQFWASWCAPCRASLPQLAELYGKYRGKGFAVVGVSLDSSKDECAAAVSSMKLPWVQLCAPAGGCAELAAAYGVDAIPANVLVNKEGTIIARNLSCEEIETLLVEAVK